jgi:hypothetical protein
MYARDRSLKEMARWKRAIEGRQKQYCPSRSFTMAKIKEAFLNPESIKHGDDDWESDNDGVSPAESSNKSRSTPPSQKKPEGCKSLISRPERQPLSPICQNSRCMGVDLLLYYSHWEDM